MPRGKRQVSLDVINGQIEAAQDLVIKRKKLYDEATDQLKQLLDKRKELQTGELINAFVKSKHSYEEILRFINSEPIE